MKKTGSLTLRWLLVLIVLLGLTHGMTLTALADGDADETVTLAENASLDGANTSRNLAVGRDGVIHIAYRSGDSIFYRKSTNSGSTFSEPVTVATGDECEVAVSSTGRVFVAYVNNSNLYIAYSDNGTSFTSVSLEGATSTSLHIAVDGSYVYAILQNGTQFFYSSDGGQSYESHTGWEVYMFSDVHVDESNHNVVILKDNPSVVCRYSSDYGETFSDESPVKCGEDQIKVYYSTATVGNGYAYMAGNNAGFDITDYLYKIDYINATATGTPISACDKNVETGRSLSADHNGNVVVGYVSNGKACYQVSLNGGDTVGSGVEFADARAANAAINTKTGDVLFLYESDGKIMLHKAAGVVPGDSIVYNGEWQYLLDSRFEPVCQEEGARYVLGTNDQTAPTEGWGDAIPQGKDAGFYYVWVQSNTTESTCKIVEIVKANALKTKPEGVAAINYNGEAQALAVAGEAASGKIVYALGESDTGPAETAYSETIPTAAEKGDYTVWYKVVGFDAQNFYADEPQSVKSNIDIYHTLTYAPGDGTGEPFTVMVKDGTSTTIPKNKFTAPDGKFFTGWSDGSAVYPAGASYTPTGNATLTAQWTLGTTISYELTDSCGDGWNGAAIEVTDKETGNVIATLTVESGSVASGTLEIPAGRTVVFTWVSGGWDNECSYTVKDAEDNVIFSGNGAMAEPKEYRYDTAILTYTVIFKVVNGSWNEGEGEAATADKTVTLTGYEGDTLKLVADQIPAVGTKPNDTYKTGSWDVEPSTETAITEATTYTYTYAQKDAAVVTKIPTAKTLTYNGQAQELVTAGEASDGTMQYALGTDDQNAPTSGWSTSIPAKTNAGTYYVWYKVIADAEHNDSEPVCIKVVIQPAAYAVLKMENTEYTIGSGKKAVITVTRNVEDNRTFSLYSGSSMDGKPIASGNCDTAPGSLVLTLKAYYLDSLSVGDHKLTISFKDGSVDTTVKILPVPPTSTAAPTATPKPVPKTGDTTNPALWLGLILLGLIGAAGTVLVSVRKK